MVMYTEYYRKLERISARNIIIPPTEYIFMSVLLLDINED